MGSSVFVETLNLGYRARKTKPAPVELRPTFVKVEKTSGAVAPING